MGLKKFTPEIRAAIKENLGKATHAEIAEILNKKFNTNFNKQSIDNYVLQKGFSYKFDPAIPGYIRSLMPLALNDVTALVNKKFNTAYCRNAIGGIMNRYGIRNGLRNHISKNKIPINEERACIVYHKPTLRVKTAEGFILKHRLIWEKAYGPIPKHHCLIFLNGDTLDCTLENLALVTRNELAIMAHSGLFSTDREITKAGIAIAKHRCTIYGMARESIEGKKAIDKMYRGAYRRQKQAEAI